LVSCSDSNWALEKCADKFYVNHLGGIDLNGLKKMSLKQKLRSVENYSAALEICAKEN
jgi:hypothetical protein